MKADTCVGRELNDARAQRQCNLATFQTLAHANRACFMLWSAIVRVFSWYWMQSGKRPKEDSVILGVRRLASATNQLLSIRKWSTCIQASVLGTILALSLSWPKWLGALATVVQYTILTLTSSLGRMMQLCNEMRTLLW